MSDRTKKILFSAAFVVIGFVAMQFPFTNLLGANVKFSLFDFYGPIVGALLGYFGAALVLIMELVNWGWHGFAMDAGTIIRFFPMLFAVLYFARKSAWTLIVPVLAMIAFWAHPEGRASWYYALYWLIPIAMYFLHNKFTFARALGATFTAHAVGGALWIWTFNMKAAIWISLIPVVWKERGLMAVGITLTYLAFNAALKFSVKKGWVNIAALRLNPTK